MVLRGSSSSGEWVVCFLFLNRLGWKGGFLDFKSTSSPCLLLPSPLGVWWLHPSSVLLSICLPICPWQTVPSPGMFLLVISYSQMTTANQRLNRIELRECLLLTNQSLFMRSMPSKLQGVFWPLWHAVGEIFGKERRSGREGQTCLHLTHLIPWL